MATGGLRFWKDGRDVPDVMLGLFDYREGFNLSLRVNFVDGGEESEGLIFTGSEGTMEIAGNTVTVTRVPREKEPGLHDRHLRRGHAEGHSSRTTSRNIRPRIPRASPAASEKYVAPARLQRQLRPLQELLSRRPHPQQPV